MPALFNTEMAGTPPNHAAPRAASFERFEGEAVFCASHQFSMEMSGICRPNTPCTAPFIMQAASSAARFETKHAFGIVFAPQFQAARHSSHKKSGSVRRRKGRCERSQCFFAARRQFLLTNGAEYDRIEVSAMGSVYAPRQLQKRIEQYHVHGILQQVFERARGQYDEERLAVEQIEPERVE